MCFRLASMGHGYGKNRHNSLHKSSPASCIILKFGLSLQLAMLGHRLAHQGPPKAEMEGLLRKGGSTPATQNETGSRKTTTDV